MFHHITVMKEEAVDSLRLKDDGVYVDCTLGGAGHSSLIASKLSDSGLLIAIDQDDAALSQARSKLTPFGDKVKLVKSNFRRIDDVVHQYSPKQQVDGILFDLGVSSPQLDEADRGFSYQHDAELDMRMDQRTTLTARHIVNDWPEEDITRILFEYGEEKFARRIVKAIVQTRTNQEIETTGQLADIVKSAIPAAARRTGPHPAKRSFQAIRIAVNDELGAMEEALRKSIGCLAPEGRIAVITFHSLEDRICKRIFAEFVERCTCPPDFPQCVCNNKAQLKLIHRKPKEPSEQEIRENPRARSAKLRVAEKLMP